jgi:AcrR family transcriptional regulator
MSRETETTADRIAKAALELFLQTGVRRTSVDEVAKHAGMTRITVYRYFSDKQGLVAACCERLSGIFERAAGRCRGKTMEEIDECLAQLGKELSELPPGNLLACLEEIHRLYPDIHEQYRAARENAHDALFRQVLMAAKREGALRSDLNMHVVRAVFQAAVMRLIENPGLISSNVSLSDVFATVTSVFRHGILRQTE